MHTPWVLSRRTQGNYEVLTKSNALFDHKNRQTSSLRQQPPHIGRFSNTPAREGGGGGGGGVWKPPDVRRLFSQASRQGIGWSLYVYLFIYTTVVRLRLITDFTEIVLYKGEGLIILKHYHSQQHHKNIEDIKTLEIYIAWLISLLRRQLNPDYIATARLF